MRFTVENGELTAISVGAALSPSDEDKTYAFTKSTALPSPPGPPPPPASFAA